MIISYIECSTKTTENYELGPNPGQETAHRLSHLLSGGSMSLVLVVDFNAHPGSYLECSPLSLKGIGRARAQTQEGVKVADDVFWDVRSWLWPGWWWSNSATEGSGVHGRPTSRLDRRRSSCSAAASSSSSSDPWGATVPTLQTSPSSLDNSLWSCSRAWPLVYAPL
jgi:hypothetical protein